MFGFLSRLFGGKSTVIKDRDIGKVRYLESEHGHVWAGSLSRAEMPALSKAEVPFFIDSKEMVLRHESKNAILDFMENYDEHLYQIEQKVLSDHSSLAGEEIILQVLHIPEPEKNYDSEWICGVGDRSFSVIFHQLKLQELILHDQ